MAVEKKGKFWIVTDEKGNVLQRLRHRPVEESKSPTKKKATRKKVAKKEDGA